MTARVKKVCRWCGSDEVVMDADARWNVDTQEWELGEVSTTPYCPPCGGETKIKDEPL